MSYLRYDYRTYNLRSEIAELREEVLSYQPGAASTCADRIVFPEKLYIGLYGRTGCGKTSLMNSLKFAAHGKLRRSQWQHAPCQEFAGGHTMFRKLANITKKLFVIDNRGLDDPNTEVAIAELAAQLDGKRGYSACAKWQGFSNRDNGNDVDNEDLDLNELDLNTGHPIGCAVLVFSARHDIDTNTTGLTEFVDFLHRHQGRYPVAVITNVDAARRSDIEKLISELLMLGLSDIFEVANITNCKQNLEELYQHMLLSLLERCMTAGDETLIFKHYQRKEQQRKLEIKRIRIEKRLKQEKEWEHKSARGRAKVENKTFHCYGSTSQVHPLEWQKI